MKIKCKHDDIARELKLRDDSLLITVDNHLESYIHLEVGDNYLMNLCLDVLCDLGYQSRPTGKPIFDATFHKSHDPIVKIY
ncbi:MAG: hypothetical protein ACPG5L_08105 [Vibrio gallaecicus]